MASTSTVPEELPQPERGVLRGDNGSPESSRRELSARQQRPALPGGRRPRGREPVRGIRRGACGSEGTLGTLHPARAAPQPPLHVSWDPFLGLVTKIRCWPNADRQQLG